MLFTRIGTVIAHFLFWLSLVGAAIALVNLFDPSLLTDDAGQPISKNPGKSLDLNVKYLFFSVLLGVLCEISERIYKTGQTTEQQA